MTPEEILQLIIILIICSCVVRIKRLELRVNYMISENCFCSRMDYPEDLLNRDVSFLTLHARTQHQRIHPIRTRMFRRSRPHFPPPQ